MSDRRDSIKIRVENTDYDVVGGSFQQLLAAVKALPGRRFLGHEKVWLVSGSLTMVQGQLENSGFQLEGGTPAPESSTPPPSDTINIQVGNYELTLTGASFGEMLSVIKAMPGRRFDGQSKVWHIPGTLSEVKAHLAEHKLTIARTVESEIANQSSKAEDTPPPAPPSNSLPPLPPAEPAGWNDYEEGYEEEFYEPPLPPTESTLSATPAPPPPPPPGLPGLQSDPNPPSNALNVDKRSDKIRVQVGDLSLAVVGGSFQEMLQAIKAIPGRRFDSENKCWVVSSDINSVQQHIKAQGFVLVED